MKIAELSFNFALEMISLCRILNEEREFVVAKQLLKCSTSIGANIEEANAAISKKEFIVKMAIASKEARETRYWLRLIDKSKIVNTPLKGHLEKIEIIIRVLTKIVKTSQLSLPNT